MAAFLSSNSPISPIFSLLSLLSFALSLSLSLAYTFSTPCLCPSTHSRTGCVTCATSAPTPSTRPCCSAPSGQVERSIFLLVLPPLYVFCPSFFVVCYDLLIKLCFVLHFVSSFPFFSSFPYSLAHTLSFLFSLSLSLSLLAL